MGILLNSSLLMGAQVARGALAQLQFVLQLRPYMNNSDLIIAVQGLVTSRLNFCNTLYARLSDECLETAISAEPSSLSGYGSEVV